MKKINQLASIFLFLLFLNSCGTVAEGLSGGKKKNSEEFFVEKKAPLVIPPSFGKLPKPGAKKSADLLSTKKDISDIEKIINQSSSTNTSEKNNDLDNSIEESIIDKIKKKKIKEVSLDKADEVDLAKATEEEKEIFKKKGFFQKIKEKFNNLEH